MASSLRFSGAFLKTRFGRRIFLMFCVAALVPAAVVFWITYQFSLDDARESERSELQSDAKEFALAVYGRLQTASEALALYRPDAQHGDSADRFLALYFNDVVVMDESDGDPDMVLGSDRMQLRDAVSTLPRSARLAVFSPARAGASHQVALLRRVSTQSGEVVIAGTLRATYLWGEPDDLNNTVRLCVRADEHPLFCGGETRARATEGWEEGEWNLFLKPAFEAPAWVFNASAARSDRIERYAGVLAPVAAGVLLLVMLLSSLQIRRVLVPLDALLTRIRSFGGDAIPVSDLRSGDEFELLSQTFDDMGVRIGNQMETLHTLADVDRLILARVPLPDVIEVVMSRMQRIVGDATVCIVVGRSGAAHLAELHVRERGSPRSVLTTLSAMPDGLEALAAQSAQGGAPVEVSDFDQGVVRTQLERCDDRYASVLSLGTDGKVRLAVVLGATAAKRISGSAMAQVRDLVERAAVAAAFEKHENLLVFQARHDLLTGLPNRLATFESLAEAITAAIASGQAFAVAFIDLDRFKAINDGLGHALGDEILIQSGMRIRHSLPAGDFVGRFGGDEFFLILRDATQPVHATCAMERVANAFSQPIVVEQREFLQRFSAGIAFFPADGEDAQALVHNADIAMYRAKKLGGARSGFFAAEMGAHARARVQMESDLRLAIANGDIELHYQPRVDSRSGRMVGAEALARWTHPIHGVVPPQVFIGLAEECGLIDGLGKLVLDKACWQLAEWTRQGFELATLGVNVSSRQLRSGKLVESIVSALGTWGIAADRLEIEVTESMLVDDSHSGATQLNEIRGLGTRIAIDDFGTGYSSLAYLTRLPSDTLKIDRAFVADLQGGGTPADAVVRSIIAIGRDLGKTLIAEGAESMEQVRILGKWGCHIIQGYVYSPPLAASGITDILVRGGIVGPAADDV